MWCKVCSYGSPDYNFKHCGHCGGTDLVSENPFTEARKSPRTLRDTRKDAKNKAKKVEDNTALTKEVEDITKGNLKSRDYETFA